MTTTLTPLLTTDIIADRLGITRKQIRAWVHRKLLVPRQRTAHGYYLWAEEDIAAITLVRDMADARENYLAQHACIAANIGRVV